MKRLFKTLILGLITINSIAQNDITSDKWNDYGNDIATTTGFKGKIGINTNTPNYNLQLHSNFTMEPVEGSPYLNYFQMTNGFTGKGSLNGLLISLVNGQSSFLSLDGFMHISAKDKLVLGGGINAQHMNILNDGKIGVGTSAPKSLLHVNNGHMRITGNNSLGGPMLLFGSNGQAIDNGQWGIEYVPSSKGNPGLNFWKPWPTTGAGNNFLFLSDNGNVGIHTDNPTARFTVNGNVLIGDPGTITLPAGYKLYVETGVLTEKVKVAIASTANWADFVFEENYVLPKLSEVASFIKENKHLPDVPSATDVVEKGVNLGEMDAVLLQKVEELTLYILQQQEAIDKLQAQINQK